MFRGKEKKNVTVVKGAANAGLPHLRPQKLGPQGFLCFSNIYRLIARDTACDGKQDGVLLGPGSASVHTHTHQDKHSKGKTNRWEDSDVRDIHVHVAPL